MARAPDGRNAFRCREVAGAGIESEGRFDNWKPTYTYGAAAVARRRRHRRPAMWTIVDYVVCDDVGRIINSSDACTAKSWARRCKGLGSVFGEELVL